MSRPFKDCDVLIIGLGPAGACAAAECAKTGLKTIGFDSKSRAGFPVQCAEFVPSLLTNETMAAYHQSQQLIDKMVTFVENEKPDEKIPFSGRIIDREKFDTELCEIAKNYGAELCFGKRIIKLEGNKAIFNDGTQIIAKVIIGADGPHSLIGKSVGVVNSQTLETRQITINLVNPINSTDIYLSAKYIGGYGWLFPKNNKANLGIGVVREMRHTLKPLLAELHRRLIDEGRVGQEILYTTGGAIPVGGMLKPYAKSGNADVLLAGDAAGLTNPISGAGIPAAVVSGRMAGEAAASILKGNSEAAQEYHQELQDLFGMSLKRARAHFEKLMAIHETAFPNPLQLRNGWIAYDEYWSEKFNNYAKGEKYDLLEA
jgi:geranylgeranyl reductase family protein